MTAAFPLHGSPTTGRQFFSFDRFDQFEIETSPHDGDASRFISPIIETGFDFNQIVGPSWNLALAPGACLWVQALPVYDERTGSFYSLGRWSGQDAHAPDRRGPISRSGGKQSNPDGELQTDVLVLSRPARKCRLRLTIIHPSNPRSLPRHEYIGVSLLHSSVSTLETAAATESGPGLILPVPTRSPTRPSRGRGVQSHERVDGSELLVSATGAVGSNRDVPEIAAAVNDPGWPGTGNWSFNTAYAGSFPGMRGCVTRLATVDELEAWIGCRGPRGRLRHLLRAQRPA